jgi:tRNA modification GTPase
MNWDIYFFLKKGLFILMSTIFGLASAAGRCGVSVFRISGPRVESVWKKLTLNKELPAPRMATLTRLYDESNRLIDHQSLALRFVAPASFTGEETLELHVHGSRAVQHALVERLASLDSDVRLAHPGEFTKRAFENGKLSLTEVEGLSDLIQAETRAQRLQSLQQLSGELGRLYEGWRRRTIELLARVEAVIDFTDDDRIESETYEKVLPLAQQLAVEMRNHLDDGGKGERVRSGVKVVLVGSPNAGKSSLYNLLLRRDAAIVTDVPGTTRDVLESTLEVGGHLVTLLDTAGLRESNDQVELLGMKRARGEYEKADVRVLVLDWRENPWSHVLEGLELPPSLIVLNKADLGNTLEARNKLQGLLNLLLFASFFLKQAARTRPWSASCHNVVFERRLEGVITRT